MATQVKTDTGKDHSESSEELTDSEEEAAPAASAAQVGTREERQSGWSDPPQSETPPLRITWVLASREAWGSCVSKTNESRKLLQPSSALSPQAKPTLGKQMKTSPRKGASASATGASASSHSKAGKVTPSASLSSLALAKGTQRTDVNSSVEQESKGAAASTAGVQVRPALSGWAHSQPWWGFLGHPETLSSFHHSRGSLGGRASQGKLPWDKGWPQYTLRRQDLPLPRSKLWLRETQRAARKNPAARKRMRPQHR